MKLVNIISFLGMASLFASCMNSQPQAEAVESHDEPQSQIDSAVIKRATINEVLSKSKPLALPYKVDLSLDCYDNKRDMYSSMWSMRENPMYNYEDNEFLFYNQVLGYLPDTTNFYAFVAFNTETDDYTPALITYDKQCNVIDVKRIRLHSAFDIVQDILEDENYMIIDKNLDLDYYCHIVKHWEDIVDQDSMTIDSELEVKNHGQILPNGKIQYEDSTQVVLKGWEKRWDNLH